MTPHLHDTEAGQEWTANEGQEGIQEQTQRQNNFATEAQPASVKKAS